MENKTKGKTPGRDAVVVIEARAPFNESMGFPKFYEVLEVNDWSYMDLGHVGPRENKEGGVFEIISYIHKSRDVEALYYDEKSKKKLEKLRGKSWALYSRLDEEGVSWEGIRKNQEYRRYESKIGDVETENKDKHGSRVHGITSYREGAENASKRIALNIGYALAKNKRLDFIDRTDVNRYDLESIAETLD